MRTPRRKVVVVSLSISAIFWFHRAKYVLAGRWLYRGTAADGSVDNSVVAEQWSSYVALPEIIPVCPKIMQPQTLTVNTPSGRVSALKGPSLSRSSTTEVGCSQTLFASWREQQRGDAQKTKWGKLISARSQFSCFFLFFFSISTVNAQAEGQGKDTPSASLHL